MLIIVRIWILLSAGVVSAGWILSALHEARPLGIGWLGLNRGCYLAGFALMLAGIAYVWRKSGWPPGQAPGRAWAVARRRYGRTAPRLFLVLLVLAGLGGILYPPPPYDCAMYRTPRVLHWLGAEQWHWIRTFDIRMNIANCGFEWLSAPLLLFTHTDRLFFLINLVSYALLPGLVFRLFRELQVRARVAWWWMWLVPGAFCFTLQAGTIANDGFAAIYALGAVVFALEARRSGKAGDLWLSLIAMMLATGVKQTDIPLTLLWLIAAWPSLRLLAGRPLGTLAAGLVALLVSALPMVLINLHHDGNWAGVPNHPGPNWTAFWQSTQSGTPFWNVIGNVLSLAIQNSFPPVFPVYRQWDDLMGHFLQTPWGAHFATFERFGFTTVTVYEQSAGLGLMVCGLLAVSLLWAWRWRRQGRAAVTAAPSWQIRALRWAPFLLLAVFMAKVTSFESARQLSPYYPFLLVAALAPGGMAAVVRRIWWQRLALLCLLVSAVWLVFLPVRPLWPAATVFGQLRARFPHSNAVLQAQSFYSVPAIHRVFRTCFAETLPADEAVVGYATDIRGLEPALWIPFTRRVERILPEDGRAYLDSQGIHYVVMDKNFPSIAGGTVDDLLKRYDARLVDQEALSHGLKDPPEPVWLIRLNPR